VPKGALIGILNTLKRVEQHGLVLHSKTESLLMPALQAGLKMTYGSFCQHVRDPSFQQQWRQALEDEKVGTITVKFSAYCDEFSIKGGRIAGAEFDEKWAISFAFSEKAVMKLQMPDGTEQIIGLTGTFEGLVDGVSYVMECDEDDEVLANERPSALNFGHANDDGCPKKNRAFDDLTNELKKLNPDDLRAQTDEYKQLLAARDLAELGFS